MTSEQAKGSAVGVSGWWLTAMIAMFVVTTFLTIYRVRLFIWHRLFQRAKRDFRWQRERLEAKLVQIDQQRVGPTVRRWVDFDDDVTFVRSRSTGQLSAFVSVMITLEHVSPSIKTNEASDSTPPFLPESEMLHIATGVFVYNKNRWDTDGRIVFNLSPSQTIRFYHRDLETVS